MQLHLAPSKAPSTAPLEMWGGVECTCNRVADRYFDQMELSGHADRMDDYTRLATLGITTLRVGLLWERHDQEPSWSWEDERMQGIRAAGIRPVVGLLHHGSGPRHTNLLDPAFPEKLAAYAGEVAARYPWVDAYTPVNEPHTTARFSALYGVWFPHHRSQESYLQALMQQLKGTVLSMEAIRRVRPDAQLVQTEDVGKISGTEEMSDTWMLHNERQWLTFDLLCGRVGPGHPLFAHLRDNGVSEADILWFAEHPCPPNIVGVNYYVTSDRYLDHRLDLYPDDRRSAEGSFVDVEAVRVAHCGITGVGPRVAEAWRRYGIPVAVTEVHLGCTVDEQIRWLAESWAGVQDARRNGAECVALTVWALLGSYFWNQLVTCDNGHYEPGAFEIRDGCLHRTDLADVVSQLSSGVAPKHRAVSQQGWWRLPTRKYFPLDITEAA